jgi:hypothetical protein
MPIVAERMEGSIYQLIFQVGSSGQQTLKTPVRKNMMRQREPLDQTLILRVHASPIRRPRVKTANDKSAELGRSEENLYITRNN